MKATLLRFGVSAIALATLLWWADADTVAEHLRGADIGWLAATLGTLTVVTFLMAKRWQIVATALHIELPFSRAVSEYYVAQLMNLILPGGVLGDVSRAVRIRHEGDLMRAAQSVAAERMLGQMALFTVMSVAFGVALLVPGGVSWPSVTWLGVIGLVSLAAAAIAVARRDTATGRFLCLVLKLMKDTRLLIYTLVIAVLLVFSLYTCARATGTVIPLRDVFTVLPLILSSMLIPLSVGGWGWREGAAAAVFPLIGASSGAGIAMGIAYGAMMMLAALPALLFVLQSRKPNPVPNTQKLESP